MLGSFLDLYKLNSLEDHVDQTDFLQFDSKHQGEEMLVRRHSRQRQDSFIRSSDSNQGGYSDEMHTIKSYTKIFIVL